MRGMERLHVAVILLCVGGASLQSGCGGAGRPSQPGPPPMLIGPEAVLLHTPDSIGHTTFEASVAFSPDGRTVAAGRMEFFPKDDRDPSSGTAVSLCDVASGRERITIRGPFAESCAVAFSPDGGTIAVGLDRAIKLYDPETGREQAELISSTSYGMLCLGFSFDGHRLAASTQFGDVVVWDLAAHQRRWGPASTCPASAAGWPGAAGMRSSRSSPRN